MSINLEELKACIKAALIAARGQSVPGDPSIAGALVAAAMRDVDPQLMRRLLAKIAEEDGER